MEQTRAPLFESLIGYQQSPPIPLHTPGHKGIAAPQELMELLTPLGLRCDLPSMDATDNLFHPHGCVAQAQQLAAELYGAAATFFLVNGSTQGVQTMMLAALAPSDKVLLSRYSHLSAFSALVLSGATPVYLPSPWLDIGGPVPPSEAEITAVLDREPDVKALFLTQPTYYGIGRDLTPIAKLCRERSILLLVDEAHGAHLTFLPPGCIAPAILCGADLVVQSPHKTLGSLVGSAQLHVGTQSPIEPSQVQTALNLLQSTSPSYLLLASLDLTRKWMYQEGRARFEDAVLRAQALHQALSQVQGVQVLSATSHPALHGCTFDPLRLVVDISQLGVSGLQAAEFLSSQFQLEGEFCDPYTIGFVLGPADDSSSYSLLIEAFSRLSQLHPVQQSPSPKELRWGYTPPLLLTPAQAARCRRERVALRSALGRICGERICIYPPGIPLIGEGEQVTLEVIAQCEALQQQSEYLFAEDPSLQTLSVLLR